MKLYTLLLFCCISFASKSQTDSETPAIDVSKIRWNYVDNSGKKCTWCATTVCTKKSSEQLRSEVDMNNPISKLSAIFFVTVTGPIYQLFDPERDPYLVDVELYDCPEFCSMKCEYEYDNRY
jgi:hypothetical protein